MIFCQEIAEHLLMMFTYKTLLVGVDQQRTLIRSWNDDSKQDWQLHVWV